MKHYAAPSQQLLAGIKAMLAAEGLEARGLRVLVAISGGPDSVCLAWALRELGAELALAHVNYGLRGAASDADEALVRDYARRWDLPLYCFHPDTLAATAHSPQSLQGAARALRYEFFERCMREQGITCCATAHHAGDQAESALMSLLQGAGTRVLRGIPARRGPYLRPLLAFSKDELLAVLEAEKLPYAHDASNDETHYLRNRYRHIALPALESVAPGAAGRIVYKLQRYEQQWRLLHKWLRPWLADSVQTRDGMQHFSWAEFERANGPEAVPVLAAAVLESWGLHGESLEMALELTDSAPGKKLPLSGATLLRSREGLSLIPLRASGGSALVTAEMLADGPLNLCLNGFAFRFQFIEEQKPDVSLPGRWLMNAEALHFPLQLRPWQAGDRMKPLGMRGFKKLSDIFTDGKYPPGAKLRALVLCDAENIIALTGFRIAEAVRAPSGGGRLLCVEIHDETDPD